MDVTLGRGGGIVEENERAIHHQNGNARHKSRP